MGGIIGAVSNLDARIGINYDTGCESLAYHEGRRFADLDEAVVGVLLRGDPAQRLEQAGETMEQH